MKEKPPFTHLDKLGGMLERCHNEMRKLRDREEWIKRQIIDEIGECDEGSKRQNGGYFTLTTTSKTVRTIDPIKLEALVDNGEIPNTIIDALVKKEHKLKLTSYRDFYKLNPDIAIIFDKCVTSKPGKTTVTAKRIERN